MPTAKTCDGEWCGKRRDLGSENLGVDKSTVSRIRQKVRNTGRISKKRYPKDKAYRKLTSTAQLLVLHLVLDKPGIFLSEISGIGKCSDAGSGYIYHLQVSPYQLLHEAKAALHCSAKG